jgi:hypothetical protein
MYHPDLPEICIRIRTSAAASILNALGIPSLSEPERQIVLKTYAPIFLQDVAASYDEIGEVFWENGQIAVDSTKPVVYYFFSYAYFFPHGNSEYRQHASTRTSCHKICGPCAFR